MEFKWTGSHTFMHPQCQYNSCVYLYLKSQNPTRRARRIELQRIHSLFNTLETMLKCQSWRQSVGNAGLHHQITIFQFISIDYGTIKPHPINQLIKSQQQETITNQFQTTYKWKEYKKKGCKWSTLRLQERKSFLQKSGSLGYGVGFLVWKRWFLRWGFGVNAKNGMERVSLSDNIRDFLSFFLKSWDERKASEQRVKLRRRNEMDRWEKLLVALALLIPIIVN